MSMCDELKDEAAMAAYVEEAARFRLQRDGTGCNERSQISRKVERQASHIHNELDRPYESSWKGEQKKKKKKKKKKKMS
jgi:hypothetical protein